MDDIPAYRLAFTFALGMHTFLERLGKERSDALSQELYLHAIRIAADIAGGHGLGYDDD